MNWNFEAMSNPRLKEIVRASTIKKDLNLHSLYMPSEEQWSLMAKDGSGGSVCWPIGSSSSTCNRWVVCAVVWSLVLGVRVEESCFWTWKKGQMMSRNNPFQSWHAFTRALELEFGPSPYESPGQALFKLTQTTTVTAYYTAFTTLANSVQGLVGLCIFLQTVLLMLRL
ncbi:hypothetical protein L195_g005138 [Trifolium pratense]|uniref:Retrotransposon gag domain-containing protein n=1 Tax=Trifolium pratense TaxID=57577 RepID=A0A2K3NZZ6_TRIPR|nr:hypothetical protein L195_g005138 [Trifolium pratense]